MVIESLIQQAKCDILAAADVAEEMIIEDGQGENILFDFIDFFGIDESFKVLDSSLKVSQCKQKIIQCLAGEYKVHMEDYSEGCIDEFVYAEMKTMGNYCQAFLKRLGGLHPDLYEQIGRTLYGDICDTLDWVATNKYNEFFNQSDFLREISNELDNSRGIRSDTQIASEFDYGF